MGFTAIWISAVTAQALIEGTPTGTGADGASYHGYWQSDLYSLNAQFGTADDLRTLSDALHARNIYMMVDVTPNHFGWSGSPDSVDYTSYNPFNNKSYFHKFCQITGDDYNDQDQTALEVCWLGDTNVELVDVDTTRQDVKSLHYSWITELVSNYSIDGIRIDTASHVQKEFWPGFNKAAGVYCVGEVDDGNPGYVCPYQDYLDGVLNYPLYYPLTQAFQSTTGNMTALADMVDTIKSSCKNSTLLGSFLENHDNPRPPSLTPDVALDQNAIAFVLLADRIPILNEGQEQHFSGGSPPNNREAVWLSGYSTSAPLYGLITKVNKLRNFVISQDSGYVNYRAYSIYNDTTTIAMRKGSDEYQIVGVFSNKDSDGAEYNRSVPSTGFARGERITEILGCTTTTADSNGSINVSMGKGAPMIFYRTAGLNGSTICGN